MGLFALAGVLAVFALVTWHRGRRPMGRWFAVYTAATAGWVLGIAALTAGASPEAWGRFTFGSASLVPAAFLGFTRVYPALSQWPSRGIVRANVAVGIVIGGLAVFTPWVVHDVKMSGDGLTRATGPLYPLFGVYFLVTWLASLAALLTQWRAARGMTRVQLQYLGTGLVILTLGAVCTNLVLPWMTGSSRYSAFGPYFVLPYFLLVGHAILRHRLLDIRVAVGRVAAFLAVITAGCLAAESVVAVLGASSLTTPTNISLGALVVLVTVAVFCSAPVAPRIDQLLSRYLFRGPVDLDRALSIATRRLTRVLTSETVARELNAILAESLVPQWTLVVLTESGLSVASNTTVNSPHLPSAARAYATSEGPAVRVLAGGSVDDFQRLDAERSLRDAGAEVVVVLGRQNEQRAIAVLGPRKDGNAYLSPALNFLDELARLAAMALDTAYVHSRELALQREEERVAHLSRLSRVYASLAHEIRTPLQTISSFVSMLPDFLEDPEYRTQLMRLVPIEVQRIISLAERLRALAPEAPTQREPVALGPLLEDMTALFRPAAEKHGIDITVNIPGDLPTVCGDRDRLAQLFQNLLRNAFEASEPGGMIAITALVTAHDILVQVADDGSGIQPAVSNSLFEPFVTTKGTGRGLGLSICLEIVEAHNGTMTLRNRPSARGAVAEVVFPRAAVDIATALPIEFHAPARRV